MLGRIRAGASLRVDEACHAGHMTTPLPPLTLLVGSEDVLIDTAIADVVRAVRRRHPDAIKRLIVAGEEGSAAAIAQALTPTLFGDTSIVVVLSGEALDESSLAMLASVTTEPEPAAICVVAHAGGAKGKKVLTALRASSPPEIACPALRKGRDTLTFMAAQVRRHGRHATNEALHVLYDAIGHDPRALAAAISQLCSDVEIDPIDESSVRRYFVGVADVAGYQVSDALWEQRTASALGDLRWIATTAGKGSVGPAVTAALAGGLRVVARVQGMPRGMSTDAVAADLKMPAWKVRTAMAQARRWRPDRLAAATVALAGLDVTVKGGLRGKSADPDQKLYAVERFIIHATQQ